MPTGWGGGHGSLCFLNLSKYCHWGNRCTRPAQKSESKTLCTASVVLQTSFVVPGFVLFKPGRGRGRTWAAEAEGKRGQPKKILAWSGGLNDLVI